MLTVSHFNFGKLSNDDTFRTIGDLVFDIVKEVIAETLGGLVTRGLGLGTGRSGGGEFSLMGSVMRAVAKVSNGGSC